MLLYHDPCQKKHNEALERFIYLYGFEDRNSTVDVVTNMQEHLRQLQHVAEGYELHFDGLDQDGKFELLAIKSQIYSLATELGFIFEGISRARARREDADSSETFAIRLDASSSDISWKMLDLDTALLAKLAIRGVRYSWLTRTDGSMSNEFLVDDLQGLDGSPDAVFSEMVVKYESTVRPVLDPSSILGGLIPYPGCAILAGRLEFIARRWRYLHHRNVQSSSASPATSNRTAGRSTNKGVHFFSSATR